LNLKIPKYETLSVCFRNGLVEEIHQGLFLKVKNGEIVYSLGNDNNYPFFLRSCMKPLQLAAISEIINTYNFSDTEIAVCTASHSGEPFHIETIKNILKKIGLSENFLLCPPQMPLNEKAKNELIQNKKSCKAIHNNCSGKHSAMLAYCVLKNFDLKTYNELTHPLQQHILKYVADLCEMDLSSCYISRDGCTLPVLGMPLKNLAIGFSKVFTDEKYAKIKNAVIKYPYYFGGHLRTDSEIIVASQGNLIAKVGAGNMCCILDLIDNSCYVIKLTDGDNYARGVILTDFLMKNKKLIKNNTLSNMFSSEIVDEIGVKVGNTKIFLPKID
jgi:L-asparaginase II